jgi:hypothetical protein
METALIGSWDEFFPAVKEAKASLGCDTVWYRGHIDAGYTLVPTLFRMGLKNTTVSNRAERSAFELFDRRVQRLRGTGEAKRDWHVLADMQHYGVPTRLLDWTSVLGIAVFFATASQVARTSRFRGPRHFFLLLSRRWYLRVCATSRRDAPLRLQHSASRQFLWNAAVSGPRRMRVAYAGDGPSPAQTPFQCEEPFPA